MANVLITDLLEESAYLVRSLLRGRGHSVSIAISSAEARAKLETGLFDTLFADLCSPSKEILGVCEYANELLPGMPVVALTTELRQKDIRGIELFGKVLRPIRGQQVNDMVERALRHALSLGTRRKHQRVTVDLPVEIAFGGERFQTRITDLSERGFAIDANGGDFGDDRLARFQELMASTVLEARIAPRKNESYTASGRIAFVDRHRRATGKMIGVVFGNLPTETQSFLSSVLDPVPATAPTEAVAA